MWLEVEYPRASVSARIGLHIVSLAILMNLDTMNMRYEAFFPFQAARKQAYP